LGKKRFLLHPVSGPKSQALFQFLAGPARALALKAFFPLALRPFEPASGAFALKEALKALEPAFSALVLAFFSACYPNN
jgi:hypothetical protein